MFFQLSCDERLERNDSFREVLQEHKNSSVAYLANVKAALLWKSACFVVRKLEVCVGCNPIARAKMKILTSQKEDAEIAERLKIRKYVVAEPPGDHE